MEFITGQQKGFRIAPEVVPLSKTAGGWRKKPTSNFSSYVPHFASEEGSALMQASDVQT